MIGHLEHGKSHRIEKTILDFSGKGINVALALAELGADVTAVCADHEDGVEQDFFASHKNISSVLIPAKGTTRVNIKLFEKQPHHMTEFNKHGTPADDAQVKRFKATLYFTILYPRCSPLPQKSSDNTFIDTRIIPTIKDPQIDSAYINQFAKFILPYIQQDYERELSQKDMPK